MRESGRCALAKLSYKGKTRIVQIRPAEDGMVSQQLLFADEVRSLSDLHIEHVTTSRNARRR
ncbi:non-homologous end joining protein Ku [Paraburkholderia sp. JPY158]|uniref:Non-homologous end joining protein Ku n=1 Tax=Paraburkholderia atlantica TaxID=2654982 RepID=A0A7W8QEM9_PARAM|nr:non-homologous end joining protein Ku [Paraburkholderia atlantica]